MIFNLIVLFLLIFSFPIAGPLNSAYAALVLALGRIALEHKINNLSKYFSSSYIKILLLSTLVITLFCSFWTIAFGVSDYSLTAAYLSLLIGIILCVTVFASLSDECIDKDYMERLVINVFVIQAIISIAAFISPGFREFVHRFQFQHDAEMADASYSGIRGLAISGRLYFEFAATCGLVIFIQFKRIINDDKAKYLEYIKLFLIIICGFFAGRTSLIGIAFGFVYLAVCHKPLRFKLQIVVKFVSVISILISLFLLVLPKDILDFISERLLPWVFDLFIKYFENGSVDGSASFNSLNEDYQFINISTEEWIIGSGIYCNPDGSYYKYIDGGYLRQILYWGIIGSIVSTLYSVLYFIRPFKRASESDYQWFVFLSFVLTMVFQYKGDMSSISRFYHVVLILIFLPATLKSQTITKRI